MFPVSEKDDKMFPNSDRGKEKQTELLANERDAVKADEIGNEIIMRLLHYTPGRKTEASY